MVSVWFCWKQDVHLIHLIKHLYHVIDPHGCDVRQRTDLETLVVSVVTVLTGVLDRETWEPFWLVGHSAD